MSGANRIGISRNPNYQDYQKINDEAAPKSPSSKNHFEGITDINKLTSTAKKPTIAEIILIIKTNNVRLGISSDVTDWATIKEKYDLVQKTALKNFKKQLFYIIDVFSLLTSDYFNGRINEWSYEETKKTGDKKTTENNRVLWGNKTLSKKNHSKSSSSLNAPQSKIVMTAAERAEKEYKENPQKYAYYELRKICPNFREATNGIRNREKTEEARNRARDWCIKTLNDVHEKIIKFIPSDINKICKFNIKEGKIFDGSTITQDIDSFSHKKASDYDFASYALVNLLKNINSLIQIENFINIIRQDLSSRNDPEARGMLNKECLGIAKTELIEALNEIFTEYSTKFDESKESIKKEKEKTLGIIQGIYGSSASSTASISSQESGDETTLPHTDEEYYLFALSQLKKTAETIPSGNNTIQPLLEAEKSFIERHNKLYPDKKIKYNLVELFGFSIFQINHSDETYNTLLEKEGFDKEIEELINKIKSNISEEDINQLQESEYIKGNEYFQGDSLKLSYKEIINNKDNNNLNYLKNILYAFSLYVDEVRNQLNL